MSQAILRENILNQQYFLALKGNSLWCKSFTHNKEIITYSYF
jgi:hypothetical protein